MSIGMMIICVIGGLAGALSTAYLTISFPAIIVILNSDTLCSNNNKEQAPFGLLFVIFILMIQICTLQFTSRC